MNCNHCDCYMEQEDVTDFKIEDYGIHSVCYQCVQKVENLLIKKSQFSPNKIIVEIKNDQHLYENYIAFMTSNCEFKEDYKIGMVNDETVVWAFDLEDLQDICTYKQPLWYLSENFLEFQKEKFEKEIQKRQDKLKQIIQKLENFFKK